MKIDDPPKAEPEKAAPALAPADGTISRPSETTKTPAP